MKKSIYKDLLATEFDDVNTYKLESRPSKVTVSDFAAVPEKGDTKSLLGSLPDILAVRSLRSVAERIVRSKKLSKPVIWGIGGHIIKTGLAPILINLMDRGYLTAIACNGSVLVHDAEIAMAGFTSEDVDSTLGDGEFGGASETGEILNRAAAFAVENAIGLGESVSCLLHNSTPEFEEYSVLCAAYKRSIPITSHITIGADIGHFHPNAVGANLGASSFKDFQLFISLVREMNGGGVYLNCGSAVTLPEIFLKAITVNKNLGHEMEDLTTANFDFLQHYRPMTNVVKRPNANGAGKGYSITGHHEIMIPLLAAQITALEK